VLKIAQSEMLWRTTDETSARTLGQLKARGLSLAIVSNSDGRIESAFQQAGIADYFDFFIDFSASVLRSPTRKSFGWQQSAPASPRMKLLMSAICMRLTSWELETRNSSQSSMIRLI
jgi:hypothetical protein